MILYVSFLSSSLAYSFLHSFLCLIIYTYTLSSDTGQMREVHVGDLVKENNFTIADIVHAVKWAGTGEEDGQTEGL